jgi:glycosyltransferase involved in cell wall biosynthesis
MEDFSEIDAVPDGKVFTISHTGVIYPGYHVDEFIVAVRKLLEDFPEAEKAIRIRFLGDIHEQILERIGVLCRQHRLSNIVSLEGKHPRQTALEVQRSSDLLLLILNEEFIQADVLTSKIFDYLAADRPILALVPPESAAGTLITESGCGSAVDPHNSHAIYEVLRKAYQGRTDGWKTNTRNEQLINKYDRNYLAKRMYNMLFSLCKVESPEQD